MTNPDDLKFEYIQHLPAVTINTDVEKLSVKSPQFITDGKENESLKLEVGSMKNELDEVRGLKKELLGIIKRLVMSHNCIKISGDSIAGLVCGECYQHLMILIIIKNKQNYVINRRH